MKTHLLFLATILIFSILSCQEKKEESSSDFVEKAYLESEKGNHIKSLKLLNQAINLDPDNILAYMNRSVDKFDLGDTLGAISDCEKVIKIDSKNIEAYFNIGFYSVLLGNYENAINAFNDADYANLKAPKIKLVVTNSDGSTDESPDYFVSIYDICYHRGDAYLKNQNYDLAINDFEFCIKSNHHKGSCLDQIARCYIKMNNLDMACIYLEKALQEGYSHSQKLIDENCK